MEKQLKLMMAVPISTKSETKSQRAIRLERLHRRRRQRMIISAVVILAVVGGFLFFSTNSPDAISSPELPKLADPGVLPPAPEGPAFFAGVNLVGAQSSTATLPPTESDPTETLPSSSPEETNLEPDPVQAQPELQIVPTQAQMITYAEGAPMLYYAQSGDSLGVLAVRFGVEVQDITSRDPLPSDGFIPEGQLLLIPNRLDETTSPLKLIPDSEVVNSPSSVGFDVAEFSRQAGGFLTNYQESVYSVGFMNGADIIEKVAREFSINPRLLLALLEYQSGWVYSEPQTDQQKTYPLGILNQDSIGLYKQLEAAAGIIETGYYGWREGTMVVLEFPDETEVRLSAQLNCGTVGLMHFFSKQVNFPEWADALYGENGFAWTYQNMFGDPWLRAVDFEPLFTPDVRQPELQLPFSQGTTWAMTVGPHAAWGAADVRAALDFAPPSAETGCHTNWSWVTASGPGLVVRSGNGAVVVDMDGDGFEQTGWNIIYLHIAANQRVPVGTWVETGDHIGHPSCEGGVSTGTHLHIVRKYNGEWVPADGPLGFVMSGWRAKAGSAYLSGWLVRGDQVVKASIVGASSSHISLD
jgi:murein DD-endopeptidase MepM/ murein hydrolase activator NlpD